MIEKDEAFIIGCLMIALLLGGMGAGAKLAWLEVNQGMLDNACDVCAHHQNITQQKEGIKEWPKINLTQWNNTPPR